MTLPSPPKHAWLVRRPATLELTDEAGRVVRRVIYVDDSATNARRARDALQQEASVLGYLVVGERRQGRRWPSIVPPAKAGGRTLVQR